MMGEENLQSFVVRFGEITCETAQSWRASSNMAKTIALMKFTGFERLTYHLYSNKHFL